MKPGTKLDRLIAEKVFGHKVVETRWGKEKQYGCLSIGEPDWWDDHGSSELHNPVPDYSTDIADAWLVVDRLRELFPGSRLNLLMTNDEVNGPGLKYQFSVIGYMGMGDFNDMANAVGDSPAHTICLAALMIVR